MRVRQRRTGLVAAVYKPLLLTTSLARTTCYRARLKLHRTGDYVRYFTKAPRPAGCGLPASGDLEFREAGPSHANDSLELGLPYDLAALELAWAPQAHARWPRE